jgi:hypothetical protein
MPMQGDGGTCTSMTTEYLGAHIKLAVTWAQAGVTNASTGSNFADIWLFSTLTVSGTKLSGMSKTCGLGLPDIHLSGATATPGTSDAKNIRLQADNTIWDKQGMPTFAVTGTQGGFDIGSTIDIDPTVGLLGVTSSSTFANISTMWPYPNAQMPMNFGTYPQFMSSDLNDPDGDHLNGIPLIPFVGTANGTKFYLVPTSANYDNEVADIVSVVSRNRLSLSGKVATCNTSNGTANVSVFENHVVACHDTMGVLANTDDYCAKSLTGVLQGPGFVDTNRTMFVPGSATYTAMLMPNGMATTCADVRTMLP